MSRYIPITVASTYRLSPTQRGEIIRRVRAGEFAGQIARAVNCAPSSVKNVAKAAGLAVSKAPAQGTFDKRVATQRRFEGRYMETVDESAAAEWRAKAYASRRFGGSGYVT